MESVMTVEYKVPLLHRLPLTRIRLRAARIMYRALKLVLREDHRLIRRGGINYEIDLAEGIDLSLFVFGGFQDHVTKTKYFPLTSDAIVLDVGANVGTMSLKFAQRAPGGHVYAFEPTGYAFQKLQRNLSLNPELSQRITPIQAFVSGRREANPSMMVYSSWKIDGSASQTHPLHGGVMQSAESADVFTIDDFCRAKQIQRIDLIKIDTDGHELQVLMGARDTIAGALPYVIFEAGLYSIEEGGDVFEQYFDYLSSFGYTLINSSNGHKVTRTNYQKEIPLRSTIDIIAVPPPQPD